MRIPIGLQTWPKDTQLTAERLTNCYAQEAPRTSRTPVKIRHGWGLAAHSTPTTASATGRGFHVWDNRLFAVIGDSLFELTAVSTWTDRGTIVTEAVVTPFLGAGNRLVSMAGIDTDGLVIATGGTRIYQWTGSVLNDISSTHSSVPNMPTIVGWVANLNDRIIYGERYSPIFVWSDPGDADTIDGTAVASADGFSDFTRLGLVANGELVMMGSEGIEFFYDAKTASNTFRRSGSGLIKRGVASEYGATVVTARGFDTIYFVGNDSKIYALAGRSLESISTPAIEEYLNGFTVRDCEAYSFGFGGSVFVVFTFRGGAMSGGAEDGTERTFIYDVRTALWHERASDSDGYWRTRTMFGCDGGRVNTGGWKVYAGDTYSNQVWTLDDENLKEDTTVQDMTIRTPFLENDGRRFSFPKLEVAAEVGKVDSGAAAIVLKTSTDGETWSAGRSRSLGATGETNTEVTWLRNGQYKKVALEFVLTGDSPRTFYYANADLVPDD